MRRAWQERPRIVLAQALGLLAVAAAAAGLGALIAHSGPDVPIATQHRLAVAERTVRAQRTAATTTDSALTRVRADLSKSRARGRRLHRRLQGETRRTEAERRDASRARRSLRLTRRALRRERAVAERER